MYPDYITFATDCVLPLKSFLYFNELHFFPKPIHPRSDLEVLVDCWTRIVLFFLQDCKNRITVFFLERIVLYFLKDCENRIVIYIFGRIERTELNCIYLKVCKIRITTPGFCTTSALQE